MPKFAMVKSLTLPCDTRIQVLIGVLRMGLRRHGMFSYSFTIVGVAAASACLSASDKWLAPISAEAGLNHNEIYQ